LDSTESVCAVLQATAPFLLAASLSPIPDITVERLLTRLRRALLLRRHEIIRNEDVMAGATTLALHCFVNEYVFFETGEERLEIAALEHELAQAAQRAPDPFLVACLGAYRPLDDYQWARAIAPPEVLEEVFRRQIDEPAEERRLRDLTPQLRPIVEETSEKVRDQYEQNPYPRWTNTALPQEATSLQDIAALRQLDVEVSAFPPTPEVLVAGCGTGQHALLAASTYLNCSVLAIDLSRASLARAQRKATELGVENIAFMQADILDLDLTDRTFDVVECIGVLNHLADPLAGWRALKGRLKPHGVMKIGLYSKSARAGVWAARALIAERGLEAGAPDDIRMFRNDVMSGEIGAFEGREAVLGTPEFYSTSECRDLVFHVSEKTFTIGSLQRALDELGLRFFGFELPASPLRAAFEREHGAENLRDLNAWEAFEAAHPATFSGMYIFWCALH
jgi:SAM-dependent methyltransferase